VLWYADILIFFAVHVSFAGERFFASIIIFQEELMRSTENMKTLT